MATDLDKLEFRLVLLGSNGTGFLFKKFETKYRPTVEDLFTKTFDLGNIEIKVDFLDTSGSMQFPAMRRLSITTGSAFLIVYSVDDENSYELTKMCVEEIREVRPDFQEIPIVFAGNKCDISRDRRQVSKEEVSNYVYNELPRNRAKVIECSCRDNINIENIFRAYLSLAKVCIYTVVSPATPSTVPEQQQQQQQQPQQHYERQSHRSSGETDHSYRCDSPTIGCSHQNNSCTGGGNNITGVSTGHINNSNTTTNNRRSSSMKTVLGVRKSCDASIISPLRRPNTAGSQPNSGQSTRALGTPTATNKEVNLETAIQSRLSIGRTSSKPRSRSLIWRPGRGKPRSAAEAGDCRIS